MRSFRPMSAALRNTVGFLGALAAGGVAAALLTNGGLNEPWPAIVGWLVFVAVGAMLVRLAKRRGAG
jgi:hypothetical protein